MVSLNGSKVTHRRPLPHTHTQAHTSTPPRQVVSLNGSKITNLAQLVGLVDSCRDAYLHFDLDYSQKVCAWGLAGGVIVGGRVLGGSRRAGSGHAQHRTPGP